MIIGEADTMESKRRVAASLNTVIDRAEIRVGCASILYPFLLTVHTDSTSHPDHILGRASVL